MTQTYECYQIGVTVDCTCVGGGGGLRDAFGHISCILSCIYDKTFDGAYIELNLGGTLIIY